MALILIVEDDSLFRSFLRDLCTAEGHTVVDAANGMDALRLLDQWGDRTPNLFIIDHKMPLMTGFELIRTLKERPTTRNVPVIMLTAMGQEVQELVQPENAIYMQKGRATNKDILDVVRRLVGPGDLKPSEDSKPLQIDRKFF